jgi:hypothetical protein
LRCLRVEGRQDDTQPARGNIARLAGNAQRSRTTGAPAHGQQHRSGSTEL